MGAYVCALVMEEFIGDRGHETVLGHCSAHHVTLFAAPGSRSPADVEHVLEEPHPDEPSGNGETAAEEAGEGAPSHQPDPPEGQPAEDESGDA